MALSNADRQRRYRQKLKSLASGHALGDRTRDAVEHAIAALWAFHERVAPGGVRWSDIDGCTSAAMYRAELQRSPGNLLETCRALLPDCEGLTDDEVRAILTVVEIADALGVAGTIPPEAQLQPMTQSIPAPSASLAARHCQTPKFPIRSTL